MKIFLDPGHGGKDPGATGNGLKEKDITLSITLKIGEILKRHNLQIVYSRTTDVFLSPSDRAKKANNANVDYFISIHTNAFTDPKAQGVETYSYPGSSIGSKLARSVQNEIIKAKIYTKNRGTKTANFAVLRETKMPAILIETAFITNKEDSQLLKYRQNDFAEAISKGILMFLGISYKPRKLYKVQVGAFSIRENAQRLVNELKGKGYETIIVVSDGLYKVQAGAFSIKRNAEKLLQQLKLDGYDAFIVY